MTQAVLRVGSKIGFLSRVKGIMARAKVSNRRLRITQCITKSEGEGFNSILRLLLQEGGSMGQEDSINQRV